MQSVAQVPTTSPTRIAYSLYPTYNSSGYFLSNYIPITSARVTYMSIKIEYAKPFGDLATHTAIVHKS